MKQKQTIFDEINDVLRPLLNKHVFKILTHHLWRALLLNR